MYAQAVSSTRKTELVYLRGLVRHDFLAAPRRQLFTALPATIDSRSPETDAVCTFDAGVSFWAISIDCSTARTERPAVRMVA